MTNSSSIEDLNNAIKSQNPFDRPLFVRQQDIWGKGFPDVPSLNAHASDGVFEAISKVRTGQRPAVGITITAEKGLGKSHIISRIRHRLQADSSALFVYMGEYGDLDRIKHEFLQTLAFSLKRLGSQEVMQWQELATAIVLQVIQKKCIPKQLVNRVTTELAKNSKLIDILTDKVLQHKPDIDNPYLVKAILWTLSIVHAPFAINWLSGKELAQSKAEEMGLPNHSSEEKEAESFKTTCQILNLISDYSTLVICFDELDGLGCDQRGFTRAQVAASLAKDIYNSIKRGVLLMAIYPETWRDYIKVMPQGEAVIDRIGEKVYELNHLNSDDVVALVSQWLKEFYDEKELTPPHPVYPFAEDELRELGKERPIVRKVLKWCADKFKVPGIMPVINVKNNHPVESAFNDEIAAIEGSSEDYLENKAALADALYLGFLALIGETLEKVKVEDVVVISAKSANQGYIDFKVIGKENGKFVKIGVAVCQQSGGNGVQAALKQLIDYKKFDLTRGCLVRSKQINSTARYAHNYLQTLLKKQGGEWVMLQIEDIRPLLAISFVNACKDYELSEEQIFDFMKQKKLAINNPLIRDILSDPSGEIPESAVDEDIPISIPLMTNIPGSADLTELDGIAH